MIENVQNEHKQAKGAKLCVNIKNGRVKNSQTFFKVLERRNMKNQTIFELNTDDKSKYSSNPMNILKSEKKKIWISTPSALPH